jgi:hypothetical protein
MFHGTLIRGQIYIVHLRGRHIKARFNQERIYDRHFNSNSYGARRGRSITHYDFTNMETGRNIILKSKVKIIRIPSPELDGITREGIPA